MKVSEMTNEQLDYLVAKAQGWELIKAGVYNNWKKPDGNFEKQEWYHPSTNWQQAGELVEKFDLLIDGRNNSAGIRRDCEWDDPKWFYADTPQRAICLAVIASVYGDEVGE